MCALHAPRHADPRSRGPRSPPDLRARIPMRSCIRAHITCTRPRRRWPALHRGRSPGTRAVQPPSGIPEAANVHVGCAPQRPIPRWIRGGTRPEISARGERGRSFAACPRAALSRHGNPKKVRKFFLSVPPEVFDVEVAISLACLCCLLGRSGADWLCWCCGSGAPVPRQRGWGGVTGLGSSGATGKAPYTCPNPRTATRPG